MEILRAESLTFRYPGESRTALDEVSFSVNEGEFVIVCGASGSGKTTLMSLIKPEIAPHGEKTGRLLFRSENLLSDLCGGGFAKIGFVAQNPEKQIISDTVERELAFGICNICKDRETIRRRVGESAAYFGIGGLMKKKTFELSGGQRQLLCLASVMAMSPEVLVLDEPTSSLDPISSAEFISMLRRLNREMGTTVIISCHRLGEVFCDADRIIMLDGGRILSDGAPSEVADAVGKSAISEALPAYIRIFSLTEGRGKVPMSIAEGRDYIRRFGRGMIPDFAPEEVFPRETAVRLKNVYFRYSREERDVICGCCAEIYKGEVFSILGGNGAGKSTLLALLCGLEKAQRGRIDIFSKSIDKYDKNSLFKGTLAALPQDAENLFVGDSVREVLSENHAEAEWLPLARELALEDLLLRNPFDLSGGEAQRLALAMVLLSYPKILLLDEPTKSLDSACKKTLSEIILGLKKSGVTVIIVTHDTDFAAEVSDRCAFLFGGEITSVDEPKGFFSENDFYTTQTSRLTRGYFERAVTVADAVRICLENGENDEKIN